MLDTTQVSVIMTAYNVEHVIGHAFESLFKQSCQDFQLIVIDDCSEDGTRDVIRSYSSYFKNMEVIYNSSNSRKATIEWEPRNDGLRLVKGSYVAYLDADNEWRPRFIERMASELDARLEAQLVFCDSCNHYSKAETDSVVKSDPRPLLDRGDTWTVYANTDPLELSRLGYDQYVDTNEMMHRVNVFKKLNSLWRVRHPRCNMVNYMQGRRRPKRRHNDLDLAERILQTYGTTSLIRVNECLVDFYYPSAERPRSYRPPEQPAVTASACSDSLFSMLNVVHFYDKYLKADNTYERLDFSVGELHNIPDYDPSGLFKSFIDSGALETGLEQYNGTRRAAGFFSELSKLYNGYLGREIFDIHSVIPFDGCHNALQIALSFSCNLGRGNAAYPVPSYPYWTLATTAGCSTNPIEAYDLETFIAKLELMAPEELRAVILPAPGNPIGYTPTTAQTVRLNELIIKNNWWLIVDGTYHFFDENSPQWLAALPWSQTILCVSSSKSWCLPGLRFGYALTADEAAAATLRAMKSSQSLLPSFIKPAFFEHLLVDHPEIPIKVSKEITSRRSALRGTLSGLDDSVFTLREHLPGPFEVLDVKTTRVPALSPKWICRELLQQNNICLMPDESFFPPNWGKPAQQHFLRICVGKISDTRYAGLKLAEALKNVTNINAESEIKQVTR